MGNLNNRVEFWGSNILGWVILSRADHVDGLWKAVFIFLALAMFIYSAVASFRSN